MTARRRHRRGLAVQTPGRRGAILDGDDRPFTRRKEVHEAPPLPLEAEPPMATNRFIRRLAAILRETADRRAQEWRNEVCEAGWVALPELAAPCSCCHRRALTPISLLTSDGEAAVRFCSYCDRLGAPMVRGD